MSAPSPGRAPPPRRPGERTRPDPPRSGPTMQQDSPLSSQARSQNPLFRAKGDLRRAMRRARARLSPDERERAADLAGRRVAELAAAEGARVVSLYAAIGAELSTDRAAAELAAAGVALAYPRVVRSERRLVFHRAAAPSALAPGSLGIPEPSSKLPRVPVDQIDLFVVPGLAFDTRGARLGWGQGYYDRVLVQNRSATRVGIAFEAQLVSYAPSTELDVPMDHIVSESGVLSCRRYLGPDGAPKR